jgi:hypothetical protein
MKTPYNPTRGIDLYLDASGEDDWQVGTASYYLVGFMACGASGEWIQWMEKHRAEYDGMIHWSAHQVGRQERKLLHPEEHCKDLMARHPWLQTGIYVFDKQAFTESVRERLGRAVKESDIVKRLWYIPAVTYLKMLIPHVKQVARHDPWGCTNIRHIIINNPKGGDKGIIERVITKEFGRMPQFVPAGHFGVDALDGVLWAFQRYFNQGKADCLPISTGDFSKDLNVCVLGVKSDIPTLLRNASEIEAFKDQL